MYPVHRKVQPRIAKKTFVFISKLVLMYYIITLLI